jgi:hypothetical protein
MKGAHTLASFYMHRAEYMWGASEQVKFTFASVSTFDWVNTRVVMVKVEVRSKFLATKQYHNQLLQISHRKILLRLYMYIYTTETTAKRVVI